MVAKGVTLGWYCYICSQKINQTKATNKKANKNQHEFEPKLPRAILPASGKGKRDKRSRKNAKTLARETGGAGGG